MISFREYLKENYSAKSIYGYEKCVEHYLDYIRSDGKTTTTSEILNYIGVLRKKDLHPKTIRNHLYSIKIYYNYLQSTGQRKDHPCKKLNLKDQINRSIAIEQLYTMEEIEQFLEEHQAKQSIVQSRDQVMISLLIYQALTTSELVNIKLEDLNLEQGILSIRSISKTQRTAGRKLALLPRQILLIDRYIREDRKLLMEKRNPQMGNTEKALLLTKYGNQMQAGSVNRQINTGTKTKKMSPLKIRQSVIHHKLKEGHNVRLVQAFAGHKSIVSTEAYRNSYIEELKQGIDRYHPYQNR